MKSYADNSAWQKVNDLLPKDHQMTSENMPIEDTWQWHGNRIHIERYPNPKAKYRLFLHHGVGTNGRQLNMIYGHRMAALGYEVVAIDNLGYGMTEVEQRDVSYSDWVSLFADFVDWETRRDPKGVILYGLSAGGMLAYNAACHMERVDGIIGMCFLKNDDPLVGNATARLPVINQLGTPLLGLLKSLGLKRAPIPMKLVSKMNLLTKDKAALKIMLRDKASAGSSVQLQFMHEYMTYRAAIPPKDFNRCPLLLTQPEDDAWTPLYLSEKSLLGLKAPLTVRILSKAGHYPMEQSGLDQLTEYSHEFISSLP